MGRSLTEPSEAAARGGQGQLSTLVSMATDTNEPSALVTAFNTVILGFSSRLKGAPECRGSSSSAPTGTAECLRCLDSRVGLRRGRKRRRNGEPQTTSVLLI